jgi:hypothetical protein
MNGGTTFTLALSDENAILQEYGGTQQKLASPNTRMRVQKLGTGRSAIYSQPCAGNGLERAAPTRLYANGDRQDVQRESVTDGDEDCEIGRA